MGGGAGYSGEPKGHGLRHLHRVHHLHGLHTQECGAVRAPLQDRERACHKVVLGLQGRQASRRLGGSENLEGGEGSGRARNLGSVALETLCDLTLALRSLSVSWRFADPTCPPRSSHTDATVINRSHAASPTGGPDLPHPHHHHVHWKGPTRCSILPQAGRPEQWATSS